ncbi:MAG: ABC transporter ATP-binding protein [Bacteroidales bacterium]|nr:ABC transporter ATP-binding protein [Bacteroidales bacterium]
MISTRACIKAAWAMSRPVRWRMFLSVSIGLVRVGASLSFVWASKRLIDIATGHSDMPISQGIVLFLCILALQLGSIILASWWDGYCAVKTANALRKDLFSHVLRSRWDGREKFLSGDTVNRLEEDIRVVGELLSERVPRLLIILTQLLAASVYMFTLAPALYWLLIVLLFSTVFGSKLFYNKLRSLMSAIRKRESELQQLMQENLQHRLLVLTLTSVERVLDRFGWLQEDIEDNTRKRLNYNAVARGLMFFGFQAGHAAAFIWGVFGILHGTVTYGMMTAFMQLVGQLQRPIAEVGTQIPAFIKAVTSIERLMELQALEQESQEPPVVLPGAPEIVLAHVGFSYPESQRTVLQDFSCRFPAGAFSVISGPTGSGKSTLTRLVLGLLKPSAGTVTVGGRPAGFELRENFMYIPQGNSLLSGTIRSNLLLAAPDASEEQLRDALETAQAGFVYELPQGLDTPCGEVGSGLSEGQAQRIAIARALLRPGGVLILDESTSSLDTATEYALLDTLHSRYHGNKTILFISHRPAALNFADAEVRVG